MDKQLCAERGQEIWQHAIETGRKVMVEGMSRIRECTVEGRASLGLDLAYVEKQSKASVPESFVVDLTTFKSESKSLTRISNSKSQSNMQLKASVPEGFVVDLTTF
eukprot:gene18413-24887_t